MKLLPIALLLLASIPSFPQVNDKAQELIALHKKKFDWFVQRKVDSLALILDDQLIYIHSSGAIESKKDILDNLKSGKSVYTKINVEQAKARLYAESGVVTGQGVFTGVNNGTPFEIPLMYTEVYVRVKKQWKLASRHANRVVN